MRPRRLARDVLAPPSRAMPTTTSGKHLGVGPWLIDLVHHDTLL